MHYMGKKRKHNSDNDVKRFVKLDRTMTNSHAFRLLSGNESKVFTILLSQYNGNNNGNLAIPYNQAENYGLSRQTLSTTLNLLEAKGFIQCTRRGYIGAISLYAVTCFGIDDCFNQSGVSVHCMKANDRPSNKWAKYNEQLKNAIAENGGSYDNKLRQKLNEELLQNFSKI